MVGIIKKIWNTCFFIKIGILRKSTRPCNIFLALFAQLMTLTIMYQHAGVGDVVGMEIGDFKVIGRFGRFELLQRYAFYFAKRSVGKKNFIAVL